MDNIFIFGKKEIFYIYLLLINLITFFAFGIDKSKAKKGKWRIPESRLLLLSLLGGTMGGLIGMLTFRHKTHKMKFTLGMPLILIINILTWILLKNQW